MKTLLFAALYGAVFGGVTEDDFYSAGACASLPVRPKFKEVCA